jgi:hypothetical protein
VKVVCIKIMVFVGFKGKNVNATKLCNVVPPDRREFSLTCSHLLVAVFRMSFLVLNAQRALMNTVMSLRVA